MSNLKNIIIRGRNEKNLAFVLADDIAERLSEVFININDELIVDYSTDDCYNVKVLLTADEVSTCTVEKTNNGFLRIDTADGEKTVSLVVFQHLSNLDIIDTL